jgi:large subunit ribosomal protein L6
MILMVDKKIKQTMKETLDIPQGVTVTANNGTFSVKGLKGEVKRPLHDPRIMSRIEGKEIVFEAESATQREKKKIMTYIAHLKTMFTGVQKGHEYKLKVCSSHFPMTVAVKGAMLEIKNFLGETVPRTVAVPQGVSMKVDGQFIVLDGVSKELVSQTAARIELKTKRPGFDKRIFQDGIYIIEKDGKALKA